MEDLKFDESKSKVSRERIGLLLYGIYIMIKGGNPFSLNKLVEDADLPVQPITQALKDCKIIENTGGSGRGAVWKWIPASSPSEILIERVFSNYGRQIAEYQRRLREKSDNRNGINRKESGKAIVQPVKPDQTPSIFIRERLEALEARESHIIDLLETLCQNLGLTETLGGRKIG